MAKKAAATLRGEKAAAPDSTESQQRPSAEVLYSAELALLAEQCADVPRPPG